MAKINLTESQILEIIDLYSNKHVALSKLSKQFHTTPETLKKIFTNRNVHIRNHRESRFTYPFNEYYFDEIDTPDKAYWLGFIYADGFIVKNHIHKRGHDILGITLTESEPLEKFNKCIECDKPIYTFFQNGYNKNTKHFRLTFPSDHMVKSLEKWGCVERKTFLLKFPNLKKDLISHFIRGYFDGDGSIFYHTTKHNDKVYNNLGITICGTRKYLIDFAKNCNLDENLVYKDFRKDTDCWSIKLASNIKCLKMYHYMYKNAGNLYLSRKREKFENFIKERGSETIIDDLNRKHKFEYLDLCYFED